MTYDEEDDDDGSASDQVLALTSSHNDQADIDAGEDDDGEDEIDEDYVDGSILEEDMNAELQELSEDLRRNVEGGENFSLDVVDEGHDANTATERPSRASKSRRKDAGLGLEGPAFLELVDEHGRPYPGIYNNPLLDFYSQHGSAEAPELPHRTLRRRNGHVNADQAITPASDPMYSAPALCGRGDSSHSNKNVRFQDEIAATPPTTILGPESSDDTDDEDFEPPIDRNAVMDESDKENTEPWEGETFSDVS